MRMRVQMVLTSLRESADFTDGREVLRQAQRSQLRDAGGNP
jgi:hypothetical protein